MAIFAIREPVRIVMAGEDDIELEVGDATMFSPRDLLKMQPGGHGLIVAVESISTQPCQFSVADAADPENSRKHLGIFCTPVAGSSTPCWQACNEIYKLLKSAQRHATDTSADAGLAMRAVLQLCAVECHRALTALSNEVNPPPEKSNAARMRAADMFISCHIGQDIRKTELAKHIGVSVSQLTLTFREVGHLSVRDRIRFRRVEFARNLLADTNLSVSAVADRVGMHYRHFIRAFRQNAKLTPLRYRKLVRLSDKSPELWSDLIYTAKFDQIEPLAGLCDSESKPDEKGSDSVSVLFSNLTSGAIRLSRRNGHEHFDEIGVVAPGKRLAFLDDPESVWKVHLYGDTSEPIFFKTAPRNSHFVIGSRNQ